MYCYNMDWATTMDFFVIDGDGKGLTVTNAHVISVESGSGLSGNGIPAPKYFPSGKGKFIILQTL